MLMKPGFLRFLFLLLFFNLIATEAVKSQVNVNDSVISAFVLSVVYSYQIPGGDMADNYGTNSTIGPAFTFKTSKNWMWSAEINFIFGSNVKNLNKIIESISTPDGNLIGQNGLYALYQSYERGFTILGKFGKLFPVFDINPNSGLFFSLGAGYIQHKIRWQVDNNTVPQLAGDYKKGYDRFSEGISLVQEFGFFYMADKRLWNFRLSFEINESFTQMKRYNFDTMGGKDGTNIDLFYGVKLAWMIPFYGRTANKTYYF